MWHSYSPDKGISLLHNNCTCISDVTLKSTFLLKQNIIHTPLFPSFLFHSVTVIKRTQNVVSKHFITFSVGQLHKQSKKIIIEHSSAEERNRKERRTHKHITTSNSSPHSLNGLGKIKNYIRVLYLYETASMAYVYTCTWKKSSVQCQKKECANPGELFRAFGCHVHVNVYIIYI